MKKFLSLFLTLFIITGFSTVEAAKALKKDISTVINDFGVDTQSMSVSIKNAENGKNIYSLNDKILMNPASVQKSWRQFLGCMVEIDSCKEAQMFRQGLDDRWSACVV